MDLLVLIPCHSRHSLCSRYDSGQLLYGEHFAGRRDYAFRQVPARRRCGLNWKTPYIDRVGGVVSLRVNQIVLTMETKTKDNVFVTIPDFSAESGSPRARIRRVLQALRSCRADQVLRRAGDSGPRSQHDAR